MNQPALWADPTWTDAYVPGQPIHDGVRDGIVSAILDDCPGGLGGIGLVVRYPDGHETTFGYDHMLSDVPVAQASDGSTVDCSPAVDPSPAGGLSPATHGAPADEAVSPPVGSHSRSPEVGTESLIAPSGGMDGQKPGRGRADTTNEETAEPAGTGSAV